MRPSKLAETDKIDNSAVEANDTESALSDLSRFCISTLTVYLDGLATDDRFTVERKLCFEMFKNWNEHDQVSFIKQIFNNMNYQQINTHLTPLLQRDFISMFATRGMFHITESILLYLDAESLKAAELVCKEWFNMISDSMLWKKLIERKVQTDFLWRGVSKRREWIQYLFKSRLETKHPPHSFYRSLYPKIIKDINSIENNWRNRKYKLTRIDCNSERSKGVYCLQYDDEKIVCGLRDNTIKIWSRNSLKCTKTLTGHTGSVLCLQYNEKVIISGSSDSTVRVWNLHSGDEINSYMHHVEAVLHLRFNNGIMVTCSRDRTVAVWNVSETMELSMRQTLVGHLAAVNVVDFDGKYIVSASGDRTIKVWNTIDCNFVRDLNGHRRGIACLQYHAGLVASGSSDNSIRLWNVETGDCIRVLEGHQQLVRCLRFDSKRIISGAYDGTIKIWDLAAALNPQSSPNSLCLGTMKEHDGKLFRLQFDELQIVSSSHDDTILIWDFLKS